MLFKAVFRFALGMAAEPTRFPKPALNKFALWKTEFNDTHFGAVSSGTTREGDMK